MPTAADLPRNAFSQQQLLDLYTNAPGDPHAAEPSLFDWGNMLDVPGLGAPPHHAAPGLPVWAPILSTVFLRRLWSGFLCNVF